LTILRISQLEVPAPLVVIVGPTAVGKTEISLRLAERLGGEIVSADSRLVYQGMDIGTAKPNREELQRVPHHLIDVVRPDENWSLAIFQRAAHRAVEAIHARDRLPLLVGGTGQFVRAVVEGWEVPQQVPDPALRSALETWAGQVGPYELHRRLARLDSQAAAQIDPTNVRRTVRALEVVFRTGRLFSSQRQRSASPYSLITIGLIRPRAELYQRVDQRIEAMIEAGLVEEVQNLLAQGYPPDLPALSAIGYREIVAYLRGRLTLTEAVMLIKRLTRRYVRQQSNWFREGDPTIHWFDLSAGNEDEVVQAVARLILSPQAWMTPGNKQGSAAE
jgi:tRNA dimethylallyltransferase